MKLPDLSALPDFTGLDAVIIAVLFVTVARGTYRGIIRELFGIAAVFGGYLLALFSHPAVAPGLGLIFPSERAAAVAAFALTFAGASLALGLVFRIAARALKVANPHKFVDHLFGLLFGAVKGLLLVAVVVLVVRMLPDGEGYLENSLTAPLVGPVAEALGDAVLEGLPEHLPEDLPQAPI